ncbi:MAG: helix-turn-helix domain-containing protein [bacterium]
MKERVLKFLQQEKKTASQFAEEIGVQRSSISHILSGRNNPSYEFILKILKRYDYLNERWLLLGEGKMYKNVVQSSIFDQPKEVQNEQNTGQTHHEKLDIEDKETPRVVTNVNSGKSIVGKEIERIIIFYNDKSFIEYFPGSR